MGTELTSFGDLLKKFRRRRGLNQRQLAVLLGVHRNTIGSWERKECLPESRGTALELTKLLYLNEHEGRLLQESSMMVAFPCWYVPYQRNPFFTGRDQLLLRLHKVLSREKTSAQALPCALIGLGGVGKTQVAIEYAYCYAYEHTAVFWIGANSQESIISHFIAVARILQLPEEREQDQHKIVAAVLHWLQTHCHWLMIFDNVEGFGIVQKFFPPVYQGSILLTTQLQPPGGGEEMGIQSVEVQQMGREEGIQFLLRRACLLSPTNEKIKPEEYAAAYSIVEIMDGLPLALDQAGAYIDETQCRLVDFLQLFQCHQGYLLRERNVYADHPQSVVKTFALAFEQILQINPAAVDLLTVCAFLASEAIPEELFIKCADFLGPTLQQVVSDPLLFDKVLVDLLAYSLIRRNVQTHTLSIHRLVQAVLKESLREEEQCNWRGRVLRAMEAIFPIDRLNIEFWPWCEQLLPHALKCINQCWNDHPTEVVSLLVKVAIYLANRARYREAVSLYERALTIQKYVRTPNFPGAVAPLEGLAGLYRFLGKYKEAEQLYQRVVSILEHELGSDHPNLVAPLTGLTDPLTGLAETYGEYGKYGEAEQLYLRVIRLRERFVGDNHLELTMPLTGLAIVYKVMGRYGEAEALLLRALSIWVSVWERDHQRMVYPQSRLKGVKMALGQDSQIYQLLWRALPILEQTRGRIVYPLIFLADVYREQGKSTEAAELFRYTLSLGERALGCDHPFLAYILSGLGEVYKQQHKFKKAEKYFLWAIHNREQLGEMHPLLVPPLMGLADLCILQELYEEADRLYCRVLKICTQSFSRDNPITTAAQKSYALLQSRLSRSV